MYAALGVAQSILVLFASHSLALGGIFASRLIHSRLLVNILRLPMSFFDTTPSGRILNRFSKDIYIIDNVIPQSVSLFIFMLFFFLSTIVVISIATPYFMIIIIPLLIFYVLVQVCKGHIVLQCTVMILYCYCRDFMWLLLVSLNDWNQTVDHRFTLTFKKFFWVSVYACV